MEVRMVNSDCPLCGEYIFPEQTSKLCPNCATLPNLDYLFLVKNDEDITDEDLNDIRNLFNR